MIIPKGKSLMEAAVLTKSAAICGYADGGGHGV
jgi:hypothetical protein